jgi:hypothetical protein
MENAAAQQALLVTGLDDGQIRALPGVQPLIRLFADGRRELAFRLPTELLVAAEID